MTSTHSWDTIVPICQHNMTSTHLLGHYRTNLSTQHDLYWRAGTLSYQSVNTTWPLLMCWDTIVPICQHNMTSTHLLGHYRTNLSTQHDLYSPPGTLSYQSVNTTWPLLTSWDTIVPICQHNMTSTHLLGHYRTNLSTQHDLYSPPGTLSYQSVNTTWPLLTSWDTIVPICQHNMTSTHLLGHYRTNLSTQHDFYPPLPTLSGLSVDTTWLLSIVTSANITWFISC